MMFLTHLVFGFLCGVIVSKLLGYGSSYLFVLVAVVASSFPDIDVLSSRISRFLSPFSVVAGSLFGHRGFFHSILALAALFLVVFSVFGAFLAVSAAVGYGSHLLLDALTVKGIRPFWPFRFRLRGFVRAGSLSEQLVMALIIGISAVAVFSGLR